jgi:nucleoside 2-deoxyribosyltransferase
VKIYLCGRYSRRDELRSVADELRRHGHTITSGWLETAWERKDDQGSSAAPAEYRQEHSVKDMEDVRAADCLVAFTEEPRSGGRGGRHVEFGMAAAWGKRLIVVGHREHLFCHLPQVEFHASRWDMVRALAKEV